MQDRSQHTNNSNSGRQGSRPNQSTQRRNGSTLDQSSSRPSQSNPRQTSGRSSQSNPRQTNVRQSSSKKSNGVSSAQSDLDRVLAQREGEARRTLGSALAKSASVADNSGKTTKRSSGVPNNYQRSNTSQRVPNASIKPEVKDNTKELNEVYSNLLSDELNRYVNKENEERKEDNSQKQKHRITIDWRRIVEGFNQAFYRSQKVLKGIATVVTGLITIACGATLLYAFVLSFKTMPDLAKCYNNAHVTIENSTKSTFKKEDNSFVYDKDGNTLAKLRQNRDTDYIKYNDIPQEVVNAFVAVEDKRFYDHHGVDLQSTAKAVEILVRGKLGESTGVERGGSTITQQMVKNVFLSNKKTYARKLKEIFLALEVEKKYSKKEILEFYINNVYFYNNCYGIASAAQSYFSKDLDQLTLAETATLCAIPNSPYYYNPVSNYSNNKERRNLILKRMRDQGYITKKAYKTAKKSNTTVIQNQRDFYNYEVSYAIDCAVENLMKQDGFEFHYSFSSVRDYKDYRKRYLEEYDLMRKELFTGGYKIKTTIDHNAQEKLQKAVDSNLVQFTKKQKDGEFLVQGAATVVDNTTGKVIAIVGGRSQESEEGNGRTLNRAFQSYNQPGSTIKPLVVYTPAFEKGYSPDTIVNDQKFEGGPSNSDGLYKGLIKVSQAIIESRNTVAWQILDDIRPKTGLKYVQNMDFSHIVPSDYYDAAALGGLTYGVNTVEMASGYATIKNGGIYRKASCIDSIEDSDGNEVAKGEVPSRVYKQYATKEITEIMQDVIKKGTGRGLSLERGMPSAGKTGTTNNQRSGWFCGFSPYYSIAVWVGTDNNDEVKDLWGGTYPGSIWKDSMNALCSSKPVVSFDTTLTQSDLLEKSGKTSSNGSTATTTEKKVATTATTESEGDEEDEDDVVSRLNDLIYDYEELEIQSDSDLAQVTSIEGEIEDLLAKLKTKDNQKFYRKVYEQAKGEVQTKINQYKSSLGNSSTQMPTDQTTSSSTTESTESDSSAGSGTDNSTDGSDDNEEFGWQN